MIDTTIHIQDILSFIVTGVLIPVGKALFKLLVELRDTVRDLNNKMGNESEATGIIGKVAKLESKMYELEKVQISHRDWLISIQDRRKQKNE